MKITQITEKELYTIISSYMGVKSEEIRIVSDTGKIIISLEETKPEEKPCLMDDDTLEAIKEFEEYEKSMDKWVEEKIELLALYEPRKDWINEDSYSVDESEIQLKHLTNAVNQHTIVLKKILKSLNK